MESQGFPEAGLRFLAELALNNERTWFSAHKKEYESAVAAPAKAMLADLVPALSELSGQEMGGKIFRIHRDVRFSKDKTPHNTHVRMAFHPTATGKGACGAKPGFFLSLEPDVIITGAGSMEFPKETLAAYRAAVDGDAAGKALEKLLKPYCGGKDGLRLEEPELKRVPAGFDPEHPRADLLRRKSLRVWQEEPVPRALHSAKAVDHLLRRFKKHLPVYRWLSTL